MICSYLFKFPNDALSLCVFVHSVFAFVVFPKQNAFSLTLLLHQTVFEAYLQLPIFSEFTSLLCRGFQSILMDFHAFCRKGHLHPCCTSTACQKFLSCLTACPAASSPSPSSPPGLRHHAPKSQRSVPGGAPGPGGEGVPPARADR